MAFLLIVVAPYVVIAAGLGLLIYLAFRRPFPFAGIIRAALLGAAAVTALVVANGLHGIAASRSSTAAIGYVFLPFVSVGVALVSLVILAALLYLLQCVTNALGWSKKITTLPLGLLSLVIVALACLLATLHFSRERVLAEANSASTVAEINSVLESATKRADTKVLSLLARNPHVSPEILERIYAIAGPEDFGIQWALADNPRTPQDILSKLGTLHERQVVVAVATNPNTPAETINRLASISDSFVRKEVASNPLLTRENLQLLAYDQDEDVRAAAAVADYKQRSATQSPAPPQ